MLCDMHSLLVKDVAGERSVPLGGTVTIGRHPSNTVRILSHAVSKFHAVIHENADGFTYEDLNSSNGSYFHELRIKKHKLADGDSIKIGEATLSYHNEVEEHDVTTLVKFEQFETKKTEYQERVDLVEVGRFLPENEVSNVNVLREDYEKLRLGQSLLQGLGNERNIHKLLNHISKELIRMLSADRCVILLVNHAGEFEAKAVQSMDTLNGPVSISQTVLKDVQSSKSAVLLSDISHSDELAQSSSLMLMGVQSVMCSPIIHHDKVIGAVQVDLRQGQGSFVKKDLQLLGGIVAYITMAVSNAGLSQKIEKEAKTQAQFERLLSPNIVRQLVAGRLKIGKAEELRHVTIMFADIRGFTSMSQKASPAAVVNMLNHYFERVVNIVFKYGGTVDKFIGDAIMVLFGAPIPMKKQEDAAVACALEIQSMMKSWNKERLARKNIEIPVGIGINSGEVVVGSIGSSQTMQYTCVGNAVNIASRLTGIAKAGQIVASKATMAGVTLRSSCDKLPPADIKGIEGQVQAYVVHAVQNYAHSDTIDEEK